MSSWKRKKGTDYPYESKQGSIRTANDQAHSSINGSQAPSSTSGTSDYVATLLSQARMVGLLPVPEPELMSSAPPAITNFAPNLGSSQLPQYPQQSAQSQVNVQPKFIACGNGVGVSYPLPPSFGSTTVDPRPLLKYSQSQFDTQDGSDPKRRKLSDSPRIRATGSPELSKSTKKAKRKKTKSAKPTPNDKRIDNLIAEALSAPTGPGFPSINSLPKFPEIPKPPDYPPPLPPIHNKALEQQCFTHRSYIHDPLKRDNSTSLMHYERLEFLGDSYMNYCVTKILYNRLSELQEGELTRFRSQIISNENIRHYAMMYGFAERILLSSGAERDDVRETSKKVADIFEAYIGGILTDQPETGEQVVYQWLSGIIAPQVTEAEKIGKVILNVNKTAKQELYVLIDAEKGPSPTYVVTKEGSTNSDFEVAVLIQGKEMGRGWGKNKNEAGTRAAMQALEILRASIVRVDAKENPDRNDHDRVGMNNDTNGQKGGNGNETTGAQNLGDLSDGEIHISTEDDG